MTHIFMYVMDTVDMSTFSVRTEGADKLIITPQVKCSGEAIARFVDHVLKMDRNAEIIVKEERNGREARL